MADISVGDVGIRLAFGSLTINLTGATCTLTITDNTGTKQSGLPMVVSSVPTTQNGVIYLANYWCYRDTVATDFTVAGITKLQPVLNLAGGVIKHIDVMYVRVGIKL